MAQQQPAPGTTPSFARGPSWGSPAQIGGSPSTPPVSDGVQRTGTSLPVNTPMTQSAGNVPGVGSWRVAGSVSDPGGTSLAVGQTSSIGYPGDQATPAGGDPRALGTSYVETDADGPGWSQFNVSANPNPGALSGGMTTAPALYPGETAPNQVSPQANPNPGGL